MWGDAGMQAAGSLTTGSCMAQLVQQYRRDATGV
jgi:hypothetical protein